MALQINILEHSILLMSPRRLKLSAWFEHIPFAFFLMEVLKPAIFVELGTHSGVSYCAFCQAVLELHLNTSCYAIDSWKGDPHAAYYASEVLADLQEHHEPLYSSFSCLIQTEFDQALQNFKNGTIDLLHIDGYHTYEAVKHDFEVWLPKMSNRGVIIFHDINVRERDFGVWQLWNELKCEYHNFEFVHGHGLGVLAVGMDQPEKFKELLNSSEYEATKIRNFFSKVGYGWKVRFSQSQNQEELAQSQKRLQTTQGELEQSQTQLHQTEGLLEQSNSQLHQTQQELEQSNSQLHQTQQELEQSNSQLHQAQQELEQSNSQLHQAQQELEQSNSQLHQAQQELEQSNSQLHQAQQELEQTQLQSHQTEAVLEQSQSQLHQMEAVLEQSQSQFHLMEAVLEQSQSQFHQMGVVLEQSQSQLHQTQVELKETQVQLHPTQLELNYTKTQLHQTQRELEDTNTQLHQIQRELEDTNTQLHIRHREWERAQFQKTLAPQPIQESQMQYELLVWDAWYAYQNENLIQMQDCLKQSLKCTPFSPTETVLKWIESFSKLSLKKGEGFDAKSLTNSAEWKQLMSRVVVSKPISYRS
ncbi:MAG: class I SAM-dependent methyltransferase [Microcoleus sp.]